ncbi:MAG: NAD-dependent epimerase/dehydratase family protein [Acidimicrobiia bacterium]
MAKPVLVTGGAGFIGLHLVDRLVAEGAEVVVVDDFRRGRQDRLFEAVAAPCRVVEADLADRHSLAPLGEFGDVYHLAASVGAALVTWNPAEVLRNNVLSTVHVLDHAAAGGADRVWLASTSEVYAASVERGLASVPTAETVPVLFEARYQPRSAYAVSKHVGEQLAHAFRHQHGLQVVACRFHNVYGPRMGHDHVIPQLVARILDRVDPFPVYGDQRRSYCYVDDALNMLLQLRDVPNPPVVVNIGNGDEEISAADLARRLFVVAGWSASVEVHPAPPGSPDRRCPDIGLAAELTGLRPAWPLDKGLEETFAWYRHEAGAPA